MKKAIAGLMFGITFLTACNQRSIGFAQGYVLGEAVGVHEVIEDPTLIDKCKNDSATDIFSELVGVYTKNPSFTKKFKELLDIYNKSDLKDDKDFKEIERLVKNA